MRMSITCMRPTLTFLGFFLCHSAFAQGARHNDIALGRDGHIAPGASVAVCTAQGVIGYGNSPCSPLATIYTDATLSTPVANPFTADPNGDYGFWAPPGTYEVQVYGPQIGVYIQTVTIPCVPNAGATGCGSVASQANNNFTGANTFSGDALFRSGDPWFDVKAFGAKCDDATDDTSALQAALAAIPPTGGLIEIPGICKFTQPLIISTPDVTIEGRGHFQFITQNAPVTYLDYQGLTGNAITVSAQGFKMRDVGVKYPTTIGGPVAAPAAPTLTQVAGSGCPVEPYFAEITYVTAQGETNVSAESVFTTTAGNCLEVLSPPAANGVTGWNVYVSSNPNNETKQTSAPITIGTNWTFTGTLQNLGFRPPFNTTASSAIFDPNGAQLDGVKIFTDAAASAGTASMANGYTSFGCCGKLHNVYIAGFGVGVAGAGSNNDFSVTDSYIQANNIGMFVVNGADINIQRNDFEGNTTGNIKVLYGSPYSVEYNYFEEQTPGAQYNVQVGDSSAPPQGFALIPGAMKIENNFMQCNLTAYPPAPIVVDTAQSLDIEKNSFSQCQNQKIIDNLAGAGASIKILGNISDAQPLAWLTSNTGVMESDLNGSSENPGQPFFYGLGVDSASGPSAFNFRNGGTSEWNMTASPDSFALSYPAHTGENALEVKPFGSQTFPSVKSDFAMTAAENIVTQSGNAATFDAGLGNLFEITVTASVTSSSLVNVQNGQWLTFIICQGAGGPFLFTWPANVFGGGTVGNVGGNCSTQSFYGSGGNAWAVGPMVQNLSTGVTGLSLPGVTGTVPYFTGAWTNGNCLQAGGSPGLIGLAASPCGTGGGGGSGTPGGSANQLQFNSAGTAFGGIPGSAATTHGGLSFFPTADTPSFAVHPFATAISDPFQVFAETHVSVPSTPTLNQTSGGTLAARTDFVQIAYADYSGAFTTYSAEQSQVVSANNLLTVTSPASSTGAAGWLPAIASATGGETKLETVSSANCTLATGLPENAPAMCAIGANWTEPMTGFNAAGLSKPSSNLTQVKAFSVDSSGNIHCQNCAVPVSAGFTASAAQPIGVDSSTGLFHNWTGAGDATNAQVLTGSVSATAPAAVGCNDTTVSISGVTTGMVVATSPQASPGANVSWSSFVSASGTVDIRLCTLVAFTPSATTYSIVVLP